VESAGVWRLYRPDAITAWRDPEIRERLDWYVAVSENRKPAKYVIASTVECGERRLEDLEIEELWKLHEELSKELDKMWREVRFGGDVKLDSWFNKSAEVSLLDLDIEIANRVVRSCYFCERRCRVNRYVQKGFCGLNHVSKVASYFLHIGEEAPLVPSGTIFFSGCNFKCVYCQNWDISQEVEYSGVAVTPQELAAMAIALRREGARNINWVGGDPTPNIHTILEAMRELVKRRVNVPQLWNSNMYLTEESMRLLLNVIDIWLPDFKYGSNDCALKYSAAPRYFEVVSRNHKLICERGENVIIRHLVLPGHIECCTKPVLKWISENCRIALVNIMDQYHPDYRVLKEDSWGELRRRVSHSEMEEAYSYASKLGISWEKVTR